MVCSMCHQQGDVWQPSFHVCSIVWYGRKLIQSRLVNFTTQVLYCTFEDKIRVTALSVVAAVIAQTSQQGHFLWSRVLQYNPRSAPYAVNAQSSTLLASRNITRKFLPAALQSLQYCSYRGRLASSSLVALYKVEYSWRSPLFSPVFDNWQPSFLNNTWASLLLFVVNSSSYALVAVYCDRTYHILARTLAAV